ncbi:DNA polymerase III subunit delta' [Oscillatoria salina]|uniref:DNA polymerase III subunit delta' n=1 Tax=Oscillatoria salina TaxID=331517 RepID=UPI0013BD9E2A|nr:DNA polymerase III subunit delta' [Oscillatoria salina]MBZ8180139.1 DNA polymerase III subunit delta' [Oscillatoria salina IIICB1]NET90976.1 DNA polymerase III subunit delta' [Kamptonema sp. SIO1D9]
MDSFAKLIGQPQAVDLLNQAVAKNRIAPAYLFAGPNGVGRRLAAQCFTQLLFCQGLPTEKQQKIQKKLQDGNHPDLYWVEPTYLHQGKLLTAKEAAEAGLNRKAPPQIRIEQIREITRFLSRPPLETSRAVVVLSAAETMAEGAANALLKTLEEPGRATIILIAPSAESLLATLVSRCQRIPFTSLSQTDLIQVLQNLGHEEILADEAVLAIAQGSPGEAILAWEQLKQIPPELLTKLKQLPKKPLDAFIFAQEINNELNTETQLWLINYLQYYYWNKFSQQRYLAQLEQTRKSLLCYAQPRLVWECTFLAMCQ